jgi:DNA (cytosine-5)-methyltransferase 1
LSEGFIRAGFEPIAHIEKKKEVCGTLCARADFH